MPKVEPRKPLRYKPSGCGMEPEYDLREVDDGSMVAELIRRGWRGFARESTKPALVKGAKPCPR